MHGPRRNMLVWGSWPPKPKPPAAPMLESLETEEMLKPDSYDTAPQEEGQAGIDLETSPEAEGAAEVTSQPGEDDRMFPPAGAPYHPPVPALGPTYPDLPFPELELAQAYIPYQRYGPTYTPAEALEKGTLFPDLYRPYDY